jgi:hypothetical protein
MISTTRSRSLPGILSLALFANTCKTRGEDAGNSVLDRWSGHEMRTSKYDNGQPQEEFSVVKDSAGNYVKDGPFVSFHPNGQKADEGNFRNGAPDGHLQRWDENGKLALDIHYKAGKREGAFEMYADGTLTQSGTYANDALNGAFRYTGIAGFVIAGEMTADAPSGEWTVTDAGAHVRARASFKNEKLVRPVQSLDETGALRPPLPAGGCADFAGFSLGTVRFADVLFDTLARVRAFPADAGVNRYSGGRMLTLSAAQLDESGIDEVTLIFDQDDTLTALSGTAPKQRGDRAYADVVKSLHAEYARKYQVLSATMPFVGDCHGEYKSGGCRIVLDAPHMGFKLDVSLRSESFGKQFAEAR